MKVFTSAVLCLLFGCLAFGQNDPCRLGLGNLLSVRGVKLKMRTADLLRLLNVTSNSDNESQSAYEGKNVGFFRSRVFESLPPTDAGNSESIRFSFESLDDEVTKFTISSTRTFDYTTPSDFKKGFEKALKIPKTCWLVSKQIGPTFNAFAAFGDFVIRFESSFSTTTTTFLLTGVDTEIANRLSVIENERRQAEAATGRELANRSVNKPTRPIIKIPIERTVVMDDKPLLPEACPIKLSDLPEVRGLRLGLDRRELDQVFPRCKNEIGSRCFLRSEDISNEVLREGLDAISITVDLDSSEINEISIIYDDSVKWLSMREFAETISTSLKLPKDKWNQVTEKSKPNLFSPMKLQCSNYSLSVSMVDEKRPNLTISKTKELLVLEESMRQQKNKKKFKP